MAAIEIGRLARGFNGGLCEDPESGCEGCICFGCGCWFKFTEEVVKLAGVVAGGFEAFFGSEIPSNPLEEEWDDTICCRYRFAAPEDEKVQDRLDLALLLLQV